MEGDQEHKFSCKICSKRFLTGRSLGGHMRGHLASISAKKHDVDPNEMGLEDGGDAGYGLRENPKQTWRVSDAKQSTKKRENRCKECGKEFPSLRALSGHMRCHSITEGENVCKQCGKAFGSMRALFGHMRHHPKRSRVSNESAENQSDCENLCPIRRKRSRTSYKVNGNISNSNASCSYVSEIDDELEEAAMCLIILSRGERKYVKSNSILECSEINSLEFEAIALHQTKGNPGYQGGKFGDLDSGFLIRSEKKTDLEVSTDGFRPADELKKPRIEFSDAEMENESEFTEVELGEVQLDQDKFDAQDPEFWRNFEDGTIYGSFISGNFVDSVKIREYRCRTCNKMFDTYQALGGHQTSHRTTNITETISKPEWNENSSDQDTSCELKKSSKDHECPICFKVFPSGQALGGHKRAHYIGFSETTTGKDGMSTKQDLPLCDLNLPITLEEEEVEADVDGEVGFKPWWVGNDHKHEPTPLVISN